MSFVRTLPKQSRKHRRCGRCYAIDFTAKRRKEISSRSSYQSSTAMTDQRVTGWALRLELLLRSLYLLGLLRCIRFHQTFFGRSFFGGFR